MYIIRLCVVVVVCDEYYKVIHVDFVFRFLHSYFPPNIIFKKKNGAENTEKHKHMNEKQSHKHAHTFLNKQLHLRTTVCVRPHKRSTWSTTVTIVIIRSATTAVVLSPLVLMVATETAVLLSIIVTASTTMLPIVVTVMMLTTAELLLFEVHLRRRMLLTVRPSLVMVLVRVVLILLLRELIAVVPGIRWAGHQGRFDFLLATNVHFGIDVDLLTTALFGQMVVLQLVSDSGMEE